MFDILYLRCLNIRHLISRMKNFQIKNLFTFSSLRYRPLFISDEKEIFESEVSRKTAVCPLCKKTSRHKHSHYTRVICDLPVWGKQTYIHLKLINKIVSQGKSIYDAVKSHRNSRLFDIAKSKLAMGCSQTNTH